MKRAALVLVVLTVLLFGACEPPAYADTPAVEYSAAHLDEVCGRLDESPSLVTFQELIDAAVLDGLTDFQAGEAIATAVITGCPEFDELMALFIERGVSVVIAL